MTDPPRPNARPTAHGDAVRRPRPPLARAGPVRGEEGDRRPGPGHRAAARLPARPRPLPARRRARPGQDARRRDARHRRRRHVHPPPVHPRPAPRRHRRHPHLPGVDGDASTSSSARSSPTSCSPTRSTGPRPRCSRRCSRSWPSTTCRSAAQTFDVPEPVPRARHAEPDRERGRLPAARGAARPLPHEDRRRLPDAGRGGRDRPPHGRAPAPRRRRCSALDDLLALQDAGRRRLRRPRRRRLRRQPRAGHPPPGQLRPPRARRRSSPTAPAPAPASAWSPAARALALLRGRTYALPQDVFDVAPDVLRHRLVLSYEALAQGLTVDHLLARLLSTVPAPAASPRRRTRPPAARRPTPRRRTVRPAPAAAPRSAAVARSPPPSSPFARPEPADAVGQRRRCASTSQADRPPSIATGPSSRGAAPARADRHAPPRRAAAGRLPRPRAGSRHRAGRDPPVRSRATTSAASTGTSPPARIEPYIRETIADRELETWVLVDLSASLDFGTADCEKRDLALAAIAAVGFLTAAHRQPHRRRRARGRAGRRPLPARTRPRPPAGAAAPRAARRPRTTIPAPPISTAALAPPGRGHPAPRPRRGRLRLPRPPASGSGRCGALGARHEVLAVEVVDPRELELPDVGVLDLVDPETGRASARSTPATPAPRARYAEAAAAPAGRDRQPHPRRRRRPPVLRTDRDWLLDLVRFVACAPRAARSPSQRLPVMTFLVPRTPVAARSARGRAGRRLRASLQFRRRELRGALHQPGPARPGRAQAPGLAPPPPRRRCSCSRCRTLVVGVRPAGHARPRCPASGPRSAWPSTPRCRWRPPTSRPTRIEAAQAAAKAFVDQLPAKINVGLVTFNGNASLVVSPTTDRDAVEPGIDSLAAGRAHRHRRGHLHLPRRASSSVPAGQGREGARPASC